MTLSMLMRPTLATEITSTAARWLSQAKTHLRVSETACRLPRLQRAAQKRLDPVCSLLTRVGSISAHRPGGG
jgi:hypothetical protein